MLRHQGMEYGYLLSGTLEITYGFDTYTLNPGESMSLDPSVPHLLTNPGVVAARGIWVVHHFVAPATD
jgi:quercetin dioxygenase-like cupin family protein